MVATAASMILLGLGATAAIAGLGAFGEFADVARASVAQPLTWSIPAVAANLGMPSPLPTLLLALVMAAIGIYAVRVPRRPSAFVLSAVATMLATTVVRVEGIAVSTVSGIAYRTTDGSTGSASEWRRTPSARLALCLGVVIAAGAIVASIGSGGLQSSSMTITNDTDAAIVVRFDVASQTASFGYVVEPAGTVTAWSDAGGSAAAATAWSVDCQFLAEMRLPRTGGHLIVTATGLRLEPQPRLGPPLAVPGDRCSVALKTRLESVPGAR
jgi:hypothetical protein